MTRRKRILMVNETSHALSGFGTYGKELLHRLVDMDKYEIAEFASSGHLGDSRDAHVRWRYYPNAVGESDDRYAEYKTKPTFEWGEWRFERVLLDFKPDIVFDIRDPWMFRWQAQSPLRPFFHWAIMPTVDSSPQEDKWISSFLEADGVFTYSDWAIDVLNKQSDNRIKIQQPAYPGVDLNIFKPVKDKRQHRIEHGCDPDAFIIGTVMRNQKRKLYPDLFAAFRQFLNQAPPELAKKTFLYVHTSYPDYAGWDIPGLLKEFELGSKVIFTYICQGTNRQFCTYFQDARAYSPYANAPVGRLPNVALGLTTEQMADIFNLFDVYVQYAICEGFGMPQVEAAACGVPVMAVNYSAMADVIQKTRGIPLKVQRMFLEFETNAYRAMPDNAYCAKAIEKFLSLSKQSKAKYSRNARKAAEEIYNWDRTAKVWADYFDSVELTGLQGKWNAPPKLHNIPTAIPDGINNADFVKWLFHAVLNEPENEYSLLALDTLRELNYGIRVADRVIKPVNKENIFKGYLNKAKNHQHCEQVRSGMLQMGEEDYIEYAHMKERLMQKGKEAAE